MSSHVRWSRGLVALALSSVMAVTTAGVVTAAPADAPAARPDVVPMVQEFYWEWSDGSDSKTRTFRESEYGTAGNLPDLLVFAEPARPQQFVKLQYKAGGTWRREDGALTNGAGKATLNLNPYCDGNWCNSRYRYRLLVNGKYTMFTITFRP